MPSLDRIYGKYVLVCIMDDGLHSAETGHKTVKAHHSELSYEVACYAEPSSETAR